jgi:hypothetical protein
MTVAVPKFHTELWLNIACHAIPDNPLVVNQSGPAEFTELYEDEFREIKSGLSEVQKARNTWSVCSQGAKTG